jgi:hypothetical protein
MAESHRPVNPALGVLHITRQVLASIRYLIEDPEALADLRRELNLPDTFGPVDKEAMGKRLMELEERHNDFDRRGEDFLLDEGTIEFLVGGEHIVALIGQMLADGDEHFVDLAYAFATIFGSEWMLRHRAPLAWAILRVLMLGYERIEDIPRFDPFAIFDRLSGGGTRVEEPGFGAAEAVGGLLVPAMVIALDTVVAKINPEKQRHHLKPGALVATGRLTFSLGWEPDGTEPEPAELLLARAMTVAFEGHLEKVGGETDYPLAFQLSALALTKEDGGPGFLLRLGGTGDITIDLGAPGHSSPFRDELELKVAGGPGAEYLWNTEAGELTFLGAEGGAPWPSGGAGARRSPPCASARRARPGSISRK